MKHPKVYVVAEVKEVTEADYKTFLNPMKTRRMGHLLKRALVTALKTIRESGIEQPDAILNGTALGCIESSERCLDALVAEGEAASTPTHFMLSTHNTVASVIAIYTGNHGYNNTYSHGNISFESALLDAFMQIRSGRIRTALVCANDETTPEMRQLLLQHGINAEYYPDRSIAVMLSSIKGDHPLREIQNITLHHHTDAPGSSDSAEITCLP